jgi:hypothetical protein
VGAFSSRLLEDTVAERWAVVVGIEKHLHPELGNLPLAEADATAVASVLESVGFPAARQVVFRGPHATKAAVEAKVKRLRKAVKRGDELVVFWAGHGFSDRESGYLAFWDTLPDHPIETSIPLAEWAEWFTGSKAGQLVFLLSIGIGPTFSQDGLTPHLDGEELRRLFDTSAKAVALAASAPDEAPQSSAITRHGLWSQLVVEALSGQSRLAAENNGHVTALSLQRFIEEEMPRRLRKHFEAGVRQTPQLYGGQNAAAVIADVSPTLFGHDADALLDPSRLRRVVFRSESSTRVKDLSQFRKTYQVPNNAGPSARRFVARLATPDIRADLDRVRDIARERLGYRRKDLEITVGQDGYGVLHTPDFEYTVFADLDPDDPSRLTWRREVGRFADPGFVSGPGFDTVFDPAFDQLVFEFARPVDVAGFVDRIEDDPPAGVRVSAASDGSACEITVTGFAGVVTIRRHALTIRGRSGEAAGLLDSFLYFLRTFGPIGDPPALPR